MRTAFAKTLTELAARDPRILLLTADLGYMALEPFSERFPDRFFNVGVAEQNMIGLATGLAEAGYIPFVYSIVTFATLRCYEFIRNGPIQHHLPVRIVGMGGGLEYGHNGLSHYGVEDVGVMRLQPGISVIAPSDHQQAREALLASWNIPGPVYYRLGKDDKTTVPGLNGRFELGKAQRLRDGTEVLIISMGAVTAEAAAAAEALATKGISVAALVVASVSPAPVDDLAQALSRCRLAITVEAHYANGGIGSLVAEIIAERGLNCRLIRRAIHGPLDGTSGSLSFLYRRHGLAREMLVEATLEALRKSGT